MEIQELKIPDAVKNQNDTQIQQAFNDLTTFKQTVVADCSGFVDEQKKRMERFTSQLKSLTDKIKYNKEECESTTKTLEEQTIELDFKIERFTKENANQNKEEQYQIQIEKLKGQYVQTCKQRIKIAEQINMFKLSKLEIDDRKSKANQVFKWIMVAMYQQSESKYYWPNFLIQAIENDKGKDLKERLGKINSSKAKDEQRVKTEHFIKNFDDISQSPEFKNIESQINNIFQIAKNFRSGYEKASKILEFEKKIAFNKEKNDEKNEQYARWKARSQALKDRITVNRQYFKALSNVELKLAPKQGLYKGKINQASQIYKEFSNILEWKPLVNVSTQQHNQCECALF